MAREPITTPRPPARGTRAESYRRLSTGRSRPRRGLGVLLLAPTALLAACHTVPVTGRSSANVFTPEYDVALGLQAYDQALAGERLAGPGPELERVQRVMDRLAAVAAETGTRWDWAVSLVENDEVINAYALPGGKMAVYTGILDVCETEAGLAVVMGHEMGHVVARHGTERLTHALGADTALALLEDGDVQAIAAAATQVFLTLPFGRGMESEADHIGLIFMARAGYDPREAIGFWERMERRAGASPPEFLSTHPSHETRIGRLRELMPEALAAWKGP